MGVSLDAFNVICGIITIIAFVLAAIQYFSDRGFKRYLEKGLLALIGILDKTAALGETESYSKSDVALLAESARDQTIGLLASFSNASERLKTYDFGFGNEEIASIIAKRRRATGIGHGGCILGGQLVRTFSGPRPIETIEEGNEVVCCDDAGRIFAGAATGLSRHHVKVCMSINETLKLTADHKVYTQNRGYVAAADLTIGDALLADNGASVPVFSLERRDGEFLVHTIETPSQNLFVSGYLVHNMPYKRESIWA